MKRWQAPAPERAVFVVGDVHGCAAQLERLLDRIDEERVALVDTAACVVFVGDYVDRGDASADVLRFLQQANVSYPDLLVCLMGNHERMMLDFLDDPTGPARRWIPYGAFQTLASFGVGAGLAKDSEDASALRAAAGELREAMGPALLDWLENLPMAWSSGSLWVVHAGADPAVPMPEQRANSLLWGADTFQKKDRKDGQWVAFGHQPFDAPFARAGRIAVDTGAVYGGKLTAATIYPGGEVSFISF